VSPDLRLSASLLDKKRIFKCAVETKEIIDSLEKQTSWSNHPSSKMWIGYVTPCKIYYNILLQESIRRGFNTSMPFYDIPDQDEYSVIPLGFDGTRTWVSGPVKNPNKTFPFFVAWPPFYMSHRAALIRKDPDFYKPLFYEPNIIPYLDYGYLWPSHLPEDAYQNFKPSFFYPMGSGTPSHYRISKENVLRWIQNPTINPITGRSIKLSGSIYKDYYKAAKHYGLVI